MTSSLLLAFGIIIFLGLSAFFVKVAVGQIGSERALFWAVVAYIVTDIMILAGLYKMGTPLMFESANWLAVASALFGAACPIGTFYLFSRMKLSIGAPMIALFPALTVVLAFLILKEKIKLVNGVGILLALAAAVLLAL